ncbi:MAG: phosphoribosylformylglycinamidine synthase [Acholeplasmatales bacterium]|nr:phosphoribosylformylglycinamidine synthase [Acholeplasmatales bacterium]
MKKRIFVEKKEGFRVEASSLLQDLNLNLGLNMKSLRLINIYDIFNIDNQLLEESLYKVFGEVVTDKVFDDIDLKKKKYLAVEYLPGQYDQRASQAEACLKLINPKTRAHVKSATLLIFDEDLKHSDLNRISEYYINKVESRVKNLKRLRDINKAHVEDVIILNGFRNLNDNELDSYIETYGLAMNKDDLRTVVEYFKNENRDPFITELKILDTYWSDHCRHTTFNTKLEEITIDESFISREIKEAYDLYLHMRKELNRENKNICLMDMATIAARYMKKNGLLDDLEVSEENNACSIYVNVKVGSKEEKWLLEFKNETHNHPTEIEPFGGASTCLGGAIRDPLSGRAYVYQAMRVTGAGNIYEAVSDTIPGKLPQRVISTKAAQGYSSYGNQIGLATTHVKEIYHDGYKAKRLEVGAVVGAVKASDVVRESPVPGDVVLMLGGRTGRDGIGGATGSSKKHNIHSIETCSSEVQKGNAPEERKIEHLFRREEVCKLIKKSNDFGAGGVSVAIGELAKGLTIYLDRIPVKYLGLNATELAISESQERMAVVVSATDKDKFMKYCKEENIEVVHIADVTKEEKLKMYYHNTLYVNLSRQFLDSEGALHKTKCHVLAHPKKEMFKRECTNLHDDALKLLSDKNVASQKGLVEMFDATIGRSTVLMPYGGVYQLSETQVSVQKLPVLKKNTTTSSIMAYGYDPYLTESSPFLGSQYAVIESIAKVVAAGAKYNKMRFSFQEYFEKMTDASSFGKPFEALLGAIKIQNDFNLPSIGGKDSMSGTFDNLHVPPMLMSFGITLVDARDVISTDFKKSGNYLYLIKHHRLSNDMPNINELKKNFDYINENILNKNIVSAYALTYGGLFEALVKCSIGNRIGFNVTYPITDILSKDYGSILVESKTKLDNMNAIYLGKTKNDSYEINKTSFTFEELFNANFGDYAKIYPICTAKETNNVTKEVKKEVVKYPFEAISKPLVFIPVFPGTNCDYDSLKAFEHAGARVKTFVFKNLTSKDVLDSIKKMKKYIDKANILMLAGGFSAADEPDGSGKFISNILNNEMIKESINALLARKGLILGICNGFQALIKSGLLPFNTLGEVSPNSATLFRNDINRHISTIATTRVANTNSPWLSGFNVGDIHHIAISHGEGKFVCSKEVAKRLFENGQVAFQYANLDGSVASKCPDNPNGSFYAIEGITSEDGLILGKMGHSERYEKYNFKNIYGTKEEDIFKNAVNYFRKK